jgi:hypothetical protein
VLSPFCLDLRDLGFKRKSACPQGDFPVTEIGNSIGDQSSQFWFPSLVLFFGIFSPLDIIHVVFLILICVVGSSIHPIHTQFLDFPEFFFFYFWVSF